MHRLAATPGGWNPETEGVIFLEQTPAPIVFLTAADTDIQTLAASILKLPESFPTLRVANLLQLQQSLSIDTYSEEILQPAQVIILRLLGGISYWSYGLSVVKEVVEKSNSHLIVLPGDDRPDPNLISHSTVSLKVANQVWRYFNEGGIENVVNALLFVGDHCLGKSYHPPLAQEVPRVGLYGEKINLLLPKVGILFYRAHYLAGNTSPIDALCEALIRRKLSPVLLFVTTLRDVEVQESVANYFQPKDETKVQLILNTTSFAVGKMGVSNSELPVLMSDIPVFQVIFSSSTLEQWEGGLQGLTPRDVAMNVALPEVDGRIITRAVSFKAVQRRNEALETDVISYEPISDRIDFVADLAASWITLKQTPIQERKIALILANYPNRDGRLANGVGLDTPASCVEILNALKQVGYRVENIPKTGNELIQKLTSSFTNDPEGHLRPVEQFISSDEYEEYFKTLPLDVQKGVSNRWYRETYSSKIPISGIQLGNVFVGIQPSRGYELDPSLNYHSPDLEPPPIYLAFYHWIRQHFGCHAIVHVGKHGNLEWLPGKSIALSKSCYPEAVLGAIPHFYPFIVNDPGEGSQAKRRAQAVIIDHLTPPMTRAELYGGLQQLEGLIDEYYEAQSLDPSRLSIISDRLTELIFKENLHQDLGIEPNVQRISDFISQADGYLCELKEAQIRDGLHIFGQCPEGQQLVDLIVAIARHPDTTRMGLTRAIAQDWNLDFDPLTADFSLPLSNNSQCILADKTQASCRIIGDAIEVLELEAAQLVQQLIKSTKLEELSNLVNQELAWIESILFPALQQTNQEITHLLRGLDGKFIPPGASGAPTRGRPDVLPTGRNFYSVDIRAIPTETAWNVGRKAAEVLIERYTQENGEYPKTLGLSVWGTSTMRTGGDDIAEALALIGVQPIWDGVSRRVVDFEILPVSVLGRPRVDCTLRISGFFRDAFPNLIDLYDSAVAAVAALDESSEQNPLASQVRKETQFWQESGLSEEQAKRRSHYRIFGSKPGAYGAGLQGLIEAQNWTDDQDLARAYINWSSYAYRAGNQSYSAPEAFEQRLQQMQIVLHNQDNREHDLLDSDDYYQFQGGLTVAVRALTGKNPQTYFGDHSLPENPRIRQLKEEIARVYRSRVVNPKWLKGVRRHGYKGAFEMAATVDYLFAYDATANCVEDNMYEGIAQAYLLDPNVQAFIKQNNPWVLRDMAERLLEANQRKLWQDVEPKLLEKLRAIAHSAEAIIEELGGQSSRQ